MLQIIEQTDEEKMAMYMKLPKKKLIEMLIACNKYIELYKKVEFYRQFKEICREK